MKQMLEQKKWAVSIFSLMVIVMVIMGLNIYQLHSVRADLPRDAGLTSMDMQSEAQPETVQSVPQGPDIIPKGIPEKYGKELGVSYDDVSNVDPKKADQTITKLGLLDRKITLKGEGQERYIHIASQIGCEYCCGAESIINKDGQAACGCAHSFAMRGLAKYLITNHGNEYTDDQILEELGKWKTLFFPGKLTEKALVLQNKGIALNYINLASNKYRDIEN